MRCRSERSSEARRVDGWLLVVIAVALASGCGSGDGSTPPVDGGMDAEPMDAAADMHSDGDVPDDAGPPPTPAERFLRDRARLLCEYGVRCEPRRWAVDEKALDLFCHPARVRRWLRRQLEGLDEGLIRFVPERAERCLSALSDIVADCGFEAAEPWLERLQACDRAFEGTAAPGEACNPLETSVRPCAPGANCYRPSEDAAEGTCVPIVGEGEACGEGVGYCRRDSEAGVNLHCEDGTCAPPLELGEPCSFNHECRGDYDCYEGVCTGPRGEGEACDGFAGSLPRCDSDAGLRCVDGECGPGLAVGEPCETLECAEGARCFGDPPRCAPITGAAEGQACYEFDFWLGSSCGEGLVCRVERSGDGFAWGTCTAGAAPGEPCEESTACALGARCVDGRCVTTALPGERCGSDTVCPRTHVCDGGRCRPLPEPGEVCDPDSGCYRGRCEDGSCCLVRDYGECDPDEDGVLLDACQTACLENECFTYTDHCADACSDACWREPDRCVPFCA